MDDIKLNENNGLGSNNASNNKEHYGSFKENVLRFNLNYFSRTAIAGIIVYACWIPIKNYNNWFSWHVILCTFGKILFLIKVGACSIIVLGALGMVGSQTAYRYIPIMAESFMLFAGDELWSRQMTRTAKYTIHGILVSVGTTMIIVGDALVYHYLSPGYHLYTAHGITGLVSMILIILSLPIGLAIKYYQEVRPYIGVRPVWYKTIHNILGLSGYIIGIVSLCYGYYTKWFIYYTDFESRLVALIVTILASLWTINAAVVSLYQQIKSLAT